MHDSLSLSDVVMLAVIELPSWQSLSAAQPGCQGEHPMNMMLASTSWASPPIRMLHPLAPS